MFSAGCFHVQYICLVTHACKGGEITHSDRSSVLDVAEIAMKFSPVMLTSARDNPPSWTTIPLEAEGPCGICTCVVSF
jgi:hypothetical protein